MSLRPRVQRSASSTQTIFDHPSRIHAAVFYPQRSPADYASIVIIAHADGVSIVWLHEPPSSSAARNFSGGLTSGGTSTAPGSRSSSVPRKLRFTGLAPGQTPVAPRYTSPLSTASLPGSTTAGSSKAGGKQRTTARFHAVPSPVTQLAILQSDVILGKANAGTKPSTMKPLSSRLLKNYMLVVVASQDASVRVLAIPMDHTDNSEVQEWTFSGVSGHRSAVETLSISIITTPSPTNPNTHTESLLIASTSRSASGLLLLYKLAIEDRDGRVVLVQSNSIVPMTLYSPALRIAFHASVPSKLLLIDEKGSLRLGDMITQNWVLIAQARRALDVCWCDGGKGIAVLWKGGELGVYEVEQGSYVSFGVVHLKAEEAKSKDDTTSDDPTLPKLIDKKIINSSKGFLTSISIGTSEALLISIDAYVWVYPLPRINSTSTATNGTSTTTTQPTAPPPRRLPVPTLSSPILSLSAQLSLSTRALTLTLPTSHRLYQISFPIPPSLLPPPSSPFIIPTRPARSRRSVDLDVDMDISMTDGNGGGGLGLGMGYMGTPGGPGAGMGMGGPAAKRRKLPPPTPHVKVLRGARDIEEARGGRRDFGQGKRKGGLLFE